MTGQWPSSVDQPKKQHIASPSDAGNTLDEYVNMDDGNGHAIFRIEKPSDPLNAAQKRNPDHHDMQALADNSQGRTPVMLEAKKKSMEKQLMREKKMRQNGWSTGRYFMVRPNHQRPQPIRPGSYLACPRHQQCRCHSGIGSQLHFP